MAVNVELEPDNTYRITVEEDGFLAWGWVSFSHLIDPKTNQLRQAIKSQAEDALLAGAAGVTLPTGDNRATA